MEDKMLCTMASDLGITKYKHETAIQYRHRVLYSASACWIKAASMDRPVTVDPTVSLGTSRRHIIDKCSAVLEELLKRYPNCRMWFEPEGSTEKPIPIIRSRLLRHGDLVNVGFDTNLALTASQHIPLTRELGCTKGAVIQRGNMYSGLAMVYWRIYSGNDNICGRLVYRVHKGCMVAANRFPRRKYSIFQSI